MRHISLLTSAFALRADAALLLPLDPRTETTSTPAQPVCTAGSDVVVNGAFYFYNNDFQTYAPWIVTPGSGSPNCQYQTGNYDLCQSGGDGGTDPDCLYVTMAQQSIFYRLTQEGTHSKCEYGNGGGSTTISQKINFAPGCEYTVE
ncbi:MAG: hypothetical protein Q9167_002038 [Letrouitia subvulpina]